MLRNTPIAIRKGRLVSVGGGSRRERPGAGVISAQGASVQVSSPDDMLEGFDARGGALLWRSMKPNGLFGAGPPLFESFRAEVEKVARRS